MNANKPMNTKQLINLIENNCPNAVVFYGLDDCIVAVHIGLPNRTNVLYSKQLIIKHIMNEQKVTHHEAMVYFDEKFLPLNKVFDKSVAPYFVDDILFDVSLN